MIDDVVVEPQPPRHIVAVVGLVTDDGGRVLMIDSPRCGWALPGGQVLVHSNLTPPANVILGFHCRATGGHITTRAESLAVEWRDRNSVVTRIAHPAVAARARELTADDDGVRYVGYRLEPFAWSVACASDSVRRHEMRRGRHVWRSRSLGGSIQPSATRCTRSSRCICRSTSRPWRGSRSCTGSNPCRSSRWTSRAFRRWGS